MAKEIYVGHISESATEEDVRKLFSVMGTVSSVHLIIDPDTGEFKRCGYVRMLSGIDLDEVVETLDGAYLIDREITVSIARPQKPGMSKSGGNKKPWMKPGPKPGADSGARPAAKTGKRPASRLEAKAETPPVQRQKTDNGARAASKPASRPGTQPAHNKHPRAGGSPSPPRKTR